MIITDKIFQRAMSRPEPLDINKEHQYLSNVNPNVLCVVDLAQDALRPVQTDIHLNECYKIVEDMIAGNINRNELLYLREQLHLIKQSEYLVEYRQACKVLRDGILTLNYLIEMQEHENHKNGYI